MKLLVNDKELAHYLISLIDLKDHCAHIELNERKTAEAIQFIIEKRDHHKFDIEKYRDKFKEKLVRGISADIEGWRRKVDTVLSNYRKNYFGQVHKRAEYVIEKLGAEKIIDAYMNSDQQYFIKTVGQQIDPTATMIRRRDFSNSIEDCLLRNTVGNEHIIVDKIDNNLPFWFIDSGYTNFIEPNKKWHRLVRNHLHFNRNFVAPADRLDIFPSFPRPWRRNGSKILYQQLLAGDYYCTVSINSNSAVESIWAGVPAITLNIHVSNAVTRNSLSQINDLYYGPLGDWLAWLSYCQFTFEELMDGTALDIIRKYHSV